ncbi:MAG: hypothetical protein ORN54_01435 [Cyclobacteriaceae bacterium]|nr:hypothetical protein [Cyclobacteriaceae bacterium]
MKIYDCFSFFNELDLLEIRLNELDPVVDVFVLVEATKTFQKKPKPLYYNENKKRFEKFHHKIRHVIVDRYPTFFSRFKIPKAMDYDHHQKDQVKQALTDCSPDDVIIFSDVDEIPKPKLLQEHKENVGVTIFQQRIYHYFLNCIEVERANMEQPAWWYGSVMTQYKNFKNVKKLRVLREINKYKGNKVIKDAGWHFTSLGGVDKIIYKIESFGHDEFNKDEFKSPKRIKELIENGKSVFGQDIQCRFKEIDDTFPEYIRNNKNKFAEYIHPLN